MSKSENNFNPLQTAYKNLDEPSKILIREKVMDKAGISMPQFYVIVRNGRAKKLQRKVFAKVIGLPENELFPTAL